MSNATGAFGLRPVRYFNGAPWNGQVIPCYVSASYATAMYIGDPVAVSSTTAYRDTTGQKLTVVRATAGATNRIDGVVVAFDELKTDLTKQYNPASTERIAYCAMDPNVVFEVRGCGGGTPTKNFTGANAVIKDGTGSTVTGLSGVVMDEGTTTAPAADLTYQLLILGLSSKVDVSLADYGLWEVLLNTCFSTAGTRLGVLGA